MAYNTRAIGGEFDNTEIVKKIVDLRIKIANILGYETYADYALEERMAKSKTTVDNFIMQLLEPSMEFAKKDVADVLAYAKKNGFEENVLQHGTSATGQRGTRRQSTLSAQRNSSLTSSSKAALMQCSALQHAFMESLLRSATISLYITRM